MLSKIRTTKTHSSLDEMVSLIKAHLVHDRSTTSSVTKAAMALESVNDNDFQQLNYAYRSLTNALENISQSVDLNNLTSAQREAGVIAGILAGDIRTSVTKKIAPIQSSDAYHVTTMAGVEDSMPVRAASIEAYDETENRDAAAYSIVYNMQASTQDEFCEAFFPTLVVSPDQVGYLITIRIMNVYEDFQRQLSGAIDDYRKKNIIRAFVDYTVLKSELTRIVPVVRPESLDKFTNPADVPARIVNLEGENITTAPLLPGIRINLLGISQTDTLIMGGLMDTTDSIDPAIVLRFIYIKIGTEVFKFNTGNLPLSTFNYNPQNNYRIQVLNFETKSLLLNKDTLLYDEVTVPTVIPTIIANDLRVRLYLTITGSVNVERGDTIVNGSPIEVVNVIDAANEQLALTDPLAVAVIAELANAEVIGYELQAYRTNLNRRQRGQLIETTYYTQAYNIPLRSPITAIHPVTTSGQTDSTDLAALITATRIRAINAGVGTLIAASQTLKEYVDARDTSNEGPDILGIGRLLVRPTYFYEEIDMALIVDSIKSYERAADMQAAIINKIRQYTYQMYRDSEYKAAADALAGGIAPKPTVIVGTDPIIYQYLMVTGDMRTLGEGFNIKIVASLDIRVRGRLFVTFVNEANINNGTPDPLSFGNFAYAPELTIVVPMSRNGQISKELAVSPRYLHVVNLPILTEMFFTNIPAVVGKVTINTHSL
jgi:hypothetical protein